MYINNRTDQAVLECRLVWALLFCIRQNRLSFDTAQTIMCTIWEMGPYDMLYDKHRLIKVFSVSIFCSIYWLLQWTLVHWQHLFPKKLPLKWICCYTEYLMSRLIVRKILLAHLSYAQDELLWSLFIRRPSVHLLLLKSWSYIDIWPFYSKVNFASLCNCMGKNIQKSYSPKPRMHCDWIFAYIIGNGRSTKVAKIIVIHWHLTFLRRGQVCFCMHLYGPHTFVWKKVNNFKWFFLWILWASVAQISCGASLGRRIKDC